MFWKNNRSGDKAKKEIFGDTVYVYTYGPSGNQQRSFPSEKSANEWLRAHGFESLSFKAQRRARRYAW